jgi:hypothetical protein
VLTEKGVDCKGWIGGPLPFNEAFCAMLQVLIKVESKID